METLVKSRVNLLINNQEVLTQNYFEVRDPGKLNEVIGEVALGTSEDVNNAVKAAHSAFLSWKNVSVQERVRLVLSAAKVLEDSMSELKHLLVKEHGGVLWEAETDFYLGNGVLNYYASVAESYMKSEQIEDKTSWISIEKVPKGVVGAIVPWNMPIILTMMKLAPALVTGNTIVIKPSPTAPIALSILLKNMARVLPDGVINVIHGDAEVGSALTQHPLVKKIAFTGGTETGKAVATNAANSFKSVTLELGGNDPAIILDDVKVENIIPKLLKGVYTRSGQICFAVKRIYVQENMLDKFYNTFCEFVDEYKVGHGLDQEASFGPLNNKKQYEFVNNLIEKEKQSGATIRKLGKKLDPDGWKDGYYILPHVVKDVTQSSSIVSCEQFGPVIPIIPYKTVDGVIKMANDSEYGLGSSVWSSDVDNALKVARQVEAGSTFINTHSFDSLSLGMPFGGVKNSGIGRELGDELTLSAYVNYHSIRYLK
ncbi:aldehyde dehydrogenase family protein [Metabacillus litoralis]|uniref:aldehyde dehydrogenase family protein n=1 Tax=Metabacillus litoralis TaxID=152268 RepID=UPI00203EF075|nr:aldehyde dehydrogenase family protein [Metabacillus litoralis]MCM3653415.1 aldehyde dehydrogenase family protein [Metabacillus litoralis]